MEPDAVIAALEAGDSRPLRDAKGTPGVSEAYFLRVARLLGEAPPEAVRLGARWRSVLTFGDRKEYVWRARGAALRAAGKWKQSAEAFLRAGSAASSNTDRRIFALGAIDSLARAGECERAVALGRRLANDLARLGEPTWSARARLNLANALVWQDRYREAEKQYRAAQQNAPTDFERASAALGLSTCLLFHRDLAEAQTRAEDARATFEELGLDAYAKQAEINLAHVDLLRGRPEDAWDRLRRIRDELDSEADRGRLEEFLGDALYQLNLLEEAQAGYEAALSISRAPLNRANAKLGLGRCAAALGDPGAHGAFASAAREYRRAANPVWTSVAEFEGARLRHDLASLQALSRRFRTLGSGYWETEALVAAAELGDAVALRSASMAIRRRGYLGLAWRVEWIRARRSGRLADYRRMARGLLADRLATRSIAARVGFLRDKRLALQEFLSLLVERDSPAALAEALRTVEATRSAALIDEIVGRSEFAPIRAEVEALRKSIEETGGSEGTRRAAPGWAGKLQTAVASVEAVVERPSAVADSVWIDLGSDLACLRAGTCGKVDGERVDRVLSWLEFEMTAPMVDRQAAPEPCLNLLSELSEALAERGRTVCPDGRLWQVPWSALPGKPPLIALNPALGGSGDVALTANPRVLIWLDRRTDLPWAEREVEEVRSKFPEAKLCETAQEAIESLAGTYDLVHIATHARLNPNNPMFSYFEFQDGPVFALEIARSRLAAKVAVLASCESGKFQLAFPDEPDGLVRAFLARGCSAVVGGLWPLDDEAAYATVVPMMAALAQGDDVRTALEKGRCACRHKFPHPYFWGPLSAFGGYIQ